jgi:hypothetical protein
LPPALAARLRAAVLRVDEPERLLDEPERLLDDDPERLFAEELDDRREPVEDEERLLDALLLRPREPELELEPLRALEDLLRGEEPPPLPLFASAISILLKGVSAPRGGRRTISCPPTR